MLQTTEEFCVTLVYTTRKHHKKAAFVLAVLLAAAVLTVLIWHTMDARSLRRTARMLRHLCVQQAGSAAQQYADELLTDATQALLGQHDDVRARKTLLKVRRIPQAPELPQGCECTAAATVLQYLHIPAQKTDLADRFLEKTDPQISADPNKAYMGDPRGEGWYCFAPPLVAAVNRYLAYHGLQDQYRAVDITGTSVETLRRHVYEGRPVIVWATLGFRKPVFTSRFLLEDGTSPYSNLHCLVLTGYDETRYLFADPLCEVYAVEQQKFVDRYEAMGKHAMLICEIPQSAA